MPKIISQEKRTEMKHELLKILSVNSRASVNEIATKLKIPKPTAYNLLNETVKEFDLRFIPEINIENVWRYEFIKLSKTHSKKEMLHRTIEKLPEMGFEEFIILFKFSSNIPSDEEIAKAIGTSHVPQFVARVHGDYDIIMYAVASNFPEVDDFAIKFTLNLKNYVITSEINKLMRGFGFFPLRNELIKKFNISDNYKDLLLGLNGDGRVQIGDLARKTKSNQMRLIYAFERLKRTDILARITYYEAKPRNVVNTIVQIKVVNQNDFMKSRHKWLLDMVKGYAEKHNEYVFACDVSNPLGILLFLSFEDSDGVEEFFSNIRRTLKGVEFKYFMMTKTLLGNLGVRNFDMRHTRQYKHLESEKLVPRFDYRDKTALTLTELPDE